MKRFLREPLLHFLVLGAAIFLAHRFATNDAGPAPNVITVTKGQVTSLAEGFARVWQRPPSLEELQGLIHEHIREEVYYREALALGLDRDDTIVRRRLRQKLEFVSADLAAETEPTADDLRAFLDDHPDLFRTEQHYSFSHVYLDPERHPGSLMEDAAKLLPSLRQAGAEVDAGNLGDATLLDHNFEDIPSSEVRKLFGDPFEIELRELELGKWLGPVESGYGFHVVLVRERTESRVPELDEIHDDVRSQWLNATRIQAGEAFFQSLLKRYKVTVEDLQSISGSGTDQAGNR